jgi:hypothetical protein
MTTAYHPQSNGMVERVHRQLKAALRSRNCGADWAEHLPSALMGIRAAPKDDTGVSSAELVYGCKMVLPGELQVPSPPIVDAALMPPPLPRPHDTRLGRKRHLRRSEEAAPCCTAAGGIRVCAAGLLRQTSRPRLQRPLRGSGEVAQVFHPSSRRRGPFLQRGPAQASHRPFACDPGATAEEGAASGGCELCSPQP